jgi:hypothetical protein
MAISVNKVYRTVLSIINKEGRGFLTPDQFNRIGRQVQLDLLERAFFDYNKALNRKKGNAINQEYANIPKNIKEKIDIFSKEANLVISTGVAPVPSDLYRTINIATSNRTINIDEVSKSKLSYINASKLTAPTSDYPVYYRESNNIKLFPTSISAAIVDYIKIPADPYWGFTKNSSNGSYEYKENLSTNFEIHESDEVDLVIKILSYTGLVIKDPTVIQVAGGEENKIIQLEN